MATSSLDVLKMWLDILVKEFEHRMQFTDQVKRWIEDRKVDKVLELAQKSTEEQVQKLPPSVQFRVHEFLLTRLYFHD